MSFSLESSFLRLSFAPNNCSWGLESQTGQAIQGITSQVHWREKKKDQKLNYSFNSQTFRTPQGASQGIAALLTVDAAGITYRINLAMPNHLPALLIQMEIENQGSAPVFLERFDFLGGKSRGGTSEFPFLSGLLPDGFLSNGWQSWSDTRSYRPQDRFRRTRLGFLTAPMRVSSGTPQPGGVGHFASDMFGVIYDRSRSQGLLAGFLSQKQGFGSLEAVLSGVQPRFALWSNGDGTRLDPGQRYATDWAWIQFISLQDSDPLADYLEAVAREHALVAPASTSVPTGWCSWYHYYSDISAEQVRQNLAAAARLRDELPMETILIDDGFEAAVGDWFDFKPSFPKGVAPLAREIREAGFKAGLWLAPFIVERRSRLAHTHRDWLLKTENDRLANAGFTFGSPFGVALDLTHPEAVDYVQKVITTAVQDWGFAYLKLDFLYAAALPGRRRDPTQSRAQALRRGLEAIRRAAGDETTLLGCGCPLGPAIGLVDSMRIGADVAERWQPAFNGIEHFFRQEPDIPAARNSIQNALTRAPLHRRWWVNDPDPLLARPETRLSLPEVQALATVIALTGGSLFLSDDLTHLPEDRLKLASSLFPPIGSRPYVLDLFDSATPQRLRLDLENSTGKWHLLAGFNWADQVADLEFLPSDFQLSPDQLWLGREFWNGTSVQLGGEGKTFHNVSPHSAVLLAVRALRDGEPAYLGSSLHISQGLEVQSWQVGPQTISFELSRPGQAKGDFELYLSNPPEKAEMDGSPLPWMEQGQGRYRFLICFNKRACIQLTFRSETNVP